MRKIFFYKSTIYFILFFTSLVHYSQEKDSLAIFSYEQLSDSFFDVAPNSKKSIVYAKAYLNKAKQSNDFLEILFGHYLMSSSTEYPNSMKHADSMINLSDKYNINNDRYPYYGYLQKAFVLHKKRNFKKSLENYFLAKKHTSDTNRLNVVNHHIGLIKNRLGHYDEALYIHKEILDYYSRTKNKSIMYVFTLFAISDCYMNTNKLDSSRVINALGMSEAIRYKHDPPKGYFTFIQGENEYKSKNYKAAIDSLTKSIDFFTQIDDKPNLSETYYYLGKSFLKTSQRKKAIQYLIKTDSMFDIMGDLSPKLRDTYEILISHSSSKENKDDQLKYLNKLLKVDSIFSANYQYLSKRIHKEFDTPKLLEEKQNLISSINKKNKSYKTVVIVMVFLILIIVFLLVYYVRKQKILKTRFDTIINDSVMLNNVSSKDNITDIGIPEIVVNQILEKLHHFEENKEYLNRSISLHSLSKNFNTNTSYLSTLINNYKNKSFKEYLNQLRITYTIERIQEDVVFRNYSIKAISYDVGFSTPEAFSKAFYKQTKLKPSYFIKNINTLN